MKIIKILLPLLLFSIFSPSISTETKTDCSQIKTDTLSDQYDKYLCEQGKPPRKKFKLGTKLKELNPFKKKNQTLNQILKKIKKLNLVLPRAPDPVGAYVAYKKIGNLLYISGQLPISEDGNILKGKIGKDLTLQDGQKASKLCVLNILAQLNKALDGNLDKVKGSIKITGFVNSTDDFKDQPKLINPASETLSTIFDEAGKHTRAAVSANSLPLGAAVEIDAIFEI